MVEVVLTIFRILKISYVYLAELSFLTDLVYDKTLEQITNQLRDGWEAQWFSDCSTGSQVQIRTECNNF